MIPSLMMTTRSSCLKCRTTAIRSATYASPRPGWRLLLARFRKSLARNLSCFRRKILGMTQHHVFEGVLLQAGFFEHLEALGNLGFRDDSLDCSDDAVPLDSFPSS